MSIPLQVTFRGIETSAAIEGHVRAKAQKLQALHGRAIDCRVSLEKPHRHAQHGQHYHVGIEVKVPGGEIVVTKAPPGDRSSQNLYTAIDAAFDVVERRLHDFEHRQRAGS
jgi:ribosomal subunit interface protein